MPWEGKDHLDNLQEIMLTLQWLVQPDTILTELPYDLQFIKKSDIERFAEWCRKSVSKQELEDGKYTVNTPIVKFFVDNNFPDLSLEKKDEKITAILKDLHALLKMPDFETVQLNNKNIDRIISITNNKKGEGHVEKTKKRIKIAVALRWLQNKELTRTLSDETKHYIAKVGDLYGMLNKGKNIEIDSLGEFTPPPDDVKKIADDYETKIEISLLEAAQEIETAKKNPDLDSSYGRLGVVVKAIKRLSNYVDKKSMQDYDSIECFKDTVFVTIIMNYVKDPYIQKTPEAKGLVKMIVPIYAKYKEIEKDL